MKKEETNILRKILFWIIFIMVMSTSLPSIFFTIVIFGKAIIIYKTILFSLTLPMLFFEFKWLDNIQNIILRKMIIKK